MLCHKRRLFLILRRENKRKTPMTQQQALQLFEEKKVRTVWDDEKEKWYFSIVDVVAVLTETDRPSKYWSDLKKKLQQEGSQLSEKIGKFKMKAEDGKNRPTDVADTEQLFRIIQSIPSPKAEPFKQWMAQVAAQRIDQMQDPELGINQAIADYRRLGYSEAWINQRIKSIEVRKALTDEWQRAGVKEGVQYASLTDIITRQWSGFTTKEYKQFKGLKKENLRDNMTNLEIALNMLAEATATEISQQENPRGFMESAEIAKRGGKAARGARASIEKELGHSVVSSMNAKHLAARKNAGELTEGKEENEC